MSSSLESEPRSLFWPSGAGQSLERAVFFGGWSLVIDFEGLAIDLSPDAEGLVLPDVCDDIGDAVGVI